MSERIATVIGATGMVGGELTDLLLHDDYYTIVRALVRRPVSLEHLKLEKKLVDFHDADSLLVAVDGSEVVFMAIGTSRKKVKGDRKAYRDVDVEIPLRIARCAATAGCQRLVVVSSAGAKTESKNFYRHLKGELEDSLAILGIESVHILRPSLLLGDRKDAGAGEKMGQFMMQAFSFFFRGRMQRYHAVSAKTVAKAMLGVSKSTEQGCFFYEYKDILRAAGLADT